MSLLESLVTAIVRADGDALVMHVGERPYVVAPDGPVELSAHALNFQSMWSMLAELLPADLQQSLEQLNVVDHHLHSIPEMGDDNYTIVAARCGDDLWVDIQRHRRPVAAPMAEAVAEAPALAQALPALVDVRASDAEGLSETDTASPETEPTIPAAQQTNTSGAAVHDVDAATALAIEPAVAPVAADTAAATTAPETAVAAAHDEPGAGVPVAPAPVAADVTAPVADATPPEPEAALPPAEAPAVTPEETPVAAAQDTPAPAAAGALSPEILARERAVREALERPSVSEPPVTPANESPSDTAPPAGAAPSGGASVIQMTRPTRVESPLFTVRPPAPMPVLESRTSSLLAAAASRGATTLYLMTDAPPFARVDGDVRTLDGGEPLSAADVEAALLEIVPEGSRDAVRLGDPAEWLFDCDGAGRVRCNSFRDYRGPGAALELISARPLAADRLAADPVIHSLATESDGLVLLTGPQGHGKTALASACVDIINRTRGCYLIALERQMRLVHEMRHALVSQRELPATPDQAVAAARAAVAERPDVLIIDEVSSSELMQLALEAAGAGVLVVATVTAPSTASAIARLAEWFPESRRGAMRALMADRLRGAIAQVLLRNPRGGRAAAREVLLPTSAVRKAIANGHRADLAAALETGRTQGLMPLNASLVELVRLGKADIREAYRKADDREGLLAALKNASVDLSLVERLA